MPILAPIVMAWLANKLMKVDQGQGQPQTQSAGGGGILGDILGQVLGGGSSAPATPTSTTQSGGVFKDQAGPAADSSTPQMQFPDQSQQTQQQESADPGLGGGILGQILGGLLGGGKR